MKKWIDQLSNAAAGIATVQSAINTVEQASSEAGGLLNHQQQNIALHALKNVNADLLRKYNEAKRKLAALDRTKAAG